MAERAEWDRPNRGGGPMYDYVIVGAGSAGCVLAARLSEDPDVSVLLLEAGPPDVNENIHVPLGYLQLARTEVDWDYDTRAGAALRRPPHLPPPRQGARRLLLDQRDGLHPRQPRRLRRLGRPRLGAGTTSSPTSSRPRTTSAAPPSGTAPAGRCRSPTSAPATPSPPPSSRPGSKPGSPATRTSTAPSRTASGCTR